MTILNPLAVTNAAVLRALAAEPRAATIAAMARDLGRDASNLKKTLMSLMADGLVTEVKGTTPPSLSAAGRAQLAGITYAETGTAQVDVGGAVTVLHADLRENPLNPRKDFDAGELAELTESIAEAGLLQPLLVTPADPAGWRMILAGARRSRAIAALIADGRWPESKRIPALERAPDASESGQAQFLGLIENGRRAPLTFLEEARGYRALIDATQWSASEAARRTGKAPRVVQEMLKVLTEATPEQLDELAAGEITARELRYAVRTPAPVAEVEAAATVAEPPPAARLELADALTLLEVAAANDDWQGAEISPDYDRAEVDALVEKGLIKAPFERGYRLYTITTHAANADLDADFPGWGRVKDRREYIERLLAELGLHVEPDRLATEWLNGPHNLTADAFARKGADQVAENERAARADRQRQSDEELRSRRMAMVDDLEAAFPSLSIADRQLRFAMVLAELNGPAPWRCSPSHTLAIAENGAEIANSSALARRMLVLAVNAMAGVDLAAHAAAIAAEAETPEAAPSRHVFEGWIRARFHELHPDVAGPLLASPAKQALDRYLEEAGEGGGPGTFEEVADATWTRHTALDVADGWLEDYELSDEAALEGENADAALVEA